MLWYNKAQVMSLKTIQKTVIYEQVIKHSRFIATITPIASEEDLERELLIIKQTYPHASHYTYAYILGYPTSINGYSDDGEPKGTAGIPMLNILVSQTLCNVLVVVVRYFGGTLLGTGGLRRAYSSAVSEGLKQAHFLFPVSYIESTFTMKYEDQNALEYQLHSLNLELKKTYENDYILFHLTYEQSLHDAIQAVVREYTHYQSVLEIFQTTIRYEKKPIE